MVQVNQGVPVMSAYYIYDSYTAVFLTNTLNMTCKLNIFKGYSIDGFYR